jgi:hypothetical protein
MKKLRSTYPLGQFLIALFTDAGLSLPDFIRALGYRNVNKGIRAFQRFLATGYGPTIFYTRLEASVFAPSSSSFEMVVQLNCEQIAQELYREHGLVADDFKEDFRPFVHAIPSLPEVESVSFFAQSGDFTTHTIRVQPKLASMPVEEQHKVIGAKIRRNYRETRGVVPFLGATRYYLYYHSWDAPPTAFTVGGTPLGIADHATIPRARVTKVSRLLDPTLVERLLHAPGDKPIH